ncbi:MAG TPA: hypothetical protein DDZ89_17405 [Clostridiales bacterium]|nr:hypothetical protein [Clostridiales bacterium]
MRHDVLRLTSAILAIFLLTNLLFARAIAPAVVFSEENTPISTDGSGSKNNSDSSTQEQETNTNDNETEQKEEQESDVIDEQDPEEEVEEEDKEKPEEQPVEPEDNEQDKDEEKDQDQNEDPEEEPSVPADDDKESEQPDLAITKFDPEGLMLIPGMSNEEVLRIKRFLLAKGYTNIEANFLYDWSTAEMVKDYQAKNNLAPDGYIGKNTFRKMNEDMEENGIQIPAVTVSFTGDIGDQRWIIINLSSNMLYHLDGETILHAYPVATGKQAGYTPQGKFTIVNKLVNPAWGGAGRQPPIKGGAPNNPLGKRWLGLDIGGGYTYGIHGNADETSIGKYVSLGCIRMPNKDVESLFEIVQTGTTVIIGSQTTLNQHGITFN